MGYPSPNGLLPIASGMAVQEYQTLSWSVLHLPHSGAPRPIRGLRWGHSAAASTPMVHLRPALP